MPCDGGQSVLQGTTAVNSQALYCPRINQQEMTMLRATIEIASAIAHDLNVSREIVWEIIKGMRCSSIEELEIKVSKALVSNHV